MFRDVRCFFYIKKNNWGTIRNFRMVRWAAKVGYKLYPSLKCYENCAENITLDDCCRNCNCRWINESVRLQNSCKIDYFNKIIIKSLCIWIFFCIFARNCVNRKSRRDHRLLMGKDIENYNNSKKEQAKHEQKGNRPSGRRCCEGGWL